MTAPNEAKRRRNEEMKATSLFPKHADNQLLGTEETVPSDGNATLLIPKEKLQFTN